MRRPKLLISNASNQFVEFVFNFIALLLLFCYDCSKMESELNSTHSTSPRSFELDIPEADGEWQLEESYPKLRFTRISKPHSKKRTAVSLIIKKMECWVLIR